MQEIKLIRLDAYNIKMNLDAISSGFSANAKKTSTSHAMLETKEEYDEVEDTSKTGKIGTLYSMSKSQDKEKMLKEGQVSLKICEGRTIAKLEDPFGKVVDEIDVSQYVEYLKNGKKNFNILADRLGQLLVELDTTKEAGTIIDKIKIICDNQERFMQQLDKVLRRNSLETEIAEENAQSMESLVNVRGMLQDMGAEEIETYIEDRQRVIGKEEVEEGLLKGPVIGDSRDNVVSFLKILSPAPEPIMKQTKKEDTKEDIGEE